MAHLFRRTAARRATAAAGAGIIAATQWPSWSPPLARAESEPRVGPPPKPMMLVRDPQALAAKLKRFTSHGATKLMVVADFDFTLTPCFHADGQPALSTHGVLLRTSAVDHQVQEIGAALFNKYYPIEQSTTLTYAQKLPEMEAWWTAKHAALATSKLTKKKITEAVRESRTHLRGGCLELLELLADAKVPTLIFSAGLSDVIHAVLDEEYSKTHKRVPENIHVVANAMRFEEQAAPGTLGTLGTLASHAVPVAVGFKDPLIHTLNKNGGSVQKTRFWNVCELEKRHNLVLLGDSLSDAKMSDGLLLPDEQVLRVGFLNDRVTEERLALYVAKFDVVLTNDCSLAPVEVLIHQIMSSSINTSHTSPVAE